MRYNSTDVWRIMAAALQSRLKRACCLQTNGWEFVIDFLHTY